MWLVLRNVVRHALTVAALGLPIAISSALAQPNIPITRDLAGARDHPLVPRYEGSFIIGYKTDRFAEVDVPLSPSTQISGTRRFEKIDAIEGARTRLLYVTPLERTSLEVMRNYKDALVAAGFEMVWECNRDRCGDASTSGCWSRGLPGRRADRSMSSFLPPSRTMSRTRRPETGSLSSWTLSKAALWKNAW